MASPISRCAQTIIRSVLIRQDLRMMAIILSSAACLTSPAVLLANPICDESFFGQFQSKTNLHLCYAALAPNCQPDSPSWNPKTGTVALMAGAGAATTRAAITSVKAYDARLVRETAEFGKAFRSGEYFKAKVYGRDIFQQTTPKITVTQTVEQLRKRLLFQATLVSTAFFSYDESPQRCNSTVEGSLKTQIIKSGICQDDFAVSPNVLKFMDLPLSEQVAQAKRFPSVCEFYQKLDEQISKDLKAIQVPIQEVQCEGSLPKSFSTQIKGKTWTLEATTKDDKLTGFTAIPDFSREQPQTIRFMDGLETKSRLNRDQMLPFMKAWWTAGPIMTKCCANPTQKDCPPTAGNTTTSPNDPQNLKGLR